MVCVVNGKVAADDSSLLMFNDDEHSAGHEIELAGEHAHATAADSVAMKCKLGEGCIEGLHL